MSRDRHSTKVGPLKALFPSQEDFARGLGVSTETAAERFEGDAARSKLRLPGANASCACPQAAAEQKSVGAATPIHVTRKVRGIGR
jgi:hypothetical protein